MGTGMRLKSVTVYVVNEVHASIKAHHFLQLFYGTFYHHSLDLGS